MANDVAATLTSPSLRVRIPDLDALASFTPDSKLLDANHVVAFNSRHIASRPFTLLRSQLTKRMKAKNLRILGITSPAPGAGKSFLSANLAATMSRLPNRVIHVFDLDIRRASLAQNFGLTGEVGLEKFLAGEVDDLALVGRHVEGTNLALYPCYRNDLDTIPLLAGTRFSDFIAALQALGDEHVILFDMPPVFANDDAMMIAAQIDAYLMLIEQGRTSPRQVTDSMRLLAPAECIGSVLNRFAGGLGDTSGYGYGAYYSDYSDYFSKSD